MANNKRQLKLHYHHSPRAYSNSRKVPSLRLCGVWLEKSGFNIGDTVQVTINKKEIIIKNS